MTTSPLEQSQLHAALDDLTDALKGHLTACINSTGESDAAVQVAYTALRTAASQYDDLLFSLLDEVTPWEFPEAPRVGDGDEEEEEEAPHIVGILVRRDYAVADGDALLTAGQEAAAEMYPDDPDDARSDGGGALYQLLHAYGVDGLDDRAEASGLEPRGGTIWVQALDDQDAATLLDDPFGIADEEALVYRLDEVMASDE
ncbi:MAG: hypothetical protein ACRDWI_16175 [Jiangellaceae bacterium]